MHESDHVEDTDVARSVDEVWTDLRELYVTWPNRASEERRMDKANLVGA